MTVPTILCVGNVALDLVLVADHIPAEDGRVEATEVALAGGGNAANAAAAIARLGLPVEFCGTVGDDAAGRVILDELDRMGVGTRFVERRAGASSTQSAVIVSATSGARTIVTHPSPPPPPIPSGFDIVHLDKTGWEAMPARGLGGAKVSLDDGNYVHDLREGLLTWYVPTAITLRKRYRTEDAVAAAELARRAGAQAVIATAGAAGSFGIDDDGLRFAPALPITPHSTLGAGDVFHGALVAAFAMGLPLQDALRFANVTAALSCRGLDGHSAVPTIDEVRHALERLPDADLPSHAIMERFTVVS